MPNRRTIYTCGCVMNKSWHEDSFDVPYGEKTQWKYCDKCAYAMAQAPLIKEALELLSNPPRARKETVLHDLGITTTQYDETISEECAAKYADALRLAKKAIQNQLDTL